MSKLKNKEARLASGSTEQTAQTESPLEESAFQNLRQKIEGNLNKATAKDSKKREQKLQNKNAASDSARGKKRALNGDIKDNANKRTPQTTARSRKEGETGKDLQDVDLKTIIAELGGTEEDLDLIGGANSDSELEGDQAQGRTTAQSEPRKGKTLESGMANILKEIALVRDTYKETDSEEEGGVKVNGAQPANTSKADDKAFRTKANAESSKLDTAKGANDQPSKGRKSKLKCEPRSDWFNCDQPDIDLNQESRFAVNPRSLEQLHSYGQSLLQVDNNAFKSTQMSSSSQAFYNTVIASGTLSDKISALTLAVQESPLHNMKALENLVAMAKKRSRSQAVDVLRALKDLFAQGSLLPGDRKLYTFSTQPALLAAMGQVKSWQEGDALPHSIRESHLITWAFEHWLKDQYFEILKVLETWCNDEIEFAKARATTYVYELLKEKPEQEANLLRLLINKLGDPVKKIASQASYLVMQLLASHPAMKEVVVMAIDTDFMFKPGQTNHARYYAAVTLNQTALSDKEENVAVKLLGIYFALFKALLKPRDENEQAQKVRSQSRHQRQRKQAASMPSTEQEDELREKLISAVLTGVNRAYPYCGTDHQSFDDHIDTLFQITHSANFNTSIQAMLLIQQLISNTSAPSDRFYRTLYESLMDSRLITSSKQQLYLNLLHRSLKADSSSKRVKAFVKRILQILSLQEPSFICGAFFLIKDLEKVFPSLMTMLDQPEDHEDDQEVFKDVDEDGTTAKPLKLENNETGKGYDPYKRAPEYANADGSCLWELLPFLAHFHPSVNVSAEHLLDHQALQGRPDLTLHTMIHFLDRFVYKNAKLSEGKMRGSSIMQPMANDDTRAVLINASGYAQRLPVNSEAFRAKKDADVAAEDVFFHRYFNNLGKSAAKKSKKRRDSMDDDASFGSDEEAEVWSVMKGTAPDLEGLDDEDQDVSDMSDFEAEMEDNRSDEGMADGLDMDDDDASVDIEPGIFDDSDDMVDGVETVIEEDEESEFVGLDSDAEEAAKSKKVKGQWKEGRDKKKKLKALPTFASAADYAKMLDNDEDEDLA
ncbi:RNA-binding ribosome biosynthesis protein mak21 [Neophaeococcomyces mojaviensis]|uniref:RNA-binding ribosome biosynthesis protein mak21 n=1 Tax=Neophaeococcomyces mojaviensis TaxID=3383035 RepID=A0ACC3A0C8_9EURO|nr:RNA-binding ribosome biosynthesis protein mak21 [Knufia sp. JES_112]